MGIYHEIVLSVVINLIIKKYRICYILIAQYIKENAMKNFRPLILFTVFVLTIGLACNAVSGGGDVTSQPQQQEPVQVQPTSEPVQQPTKAPEPTQILEPTSVPTEPPVTVSKYFKEEFDSSDVLDNYLYFSLGSGDDADLVIQQEDDHLLFDLGDEDLYVYYMYVADIYDDVAIALNAENRGRNNNNVSLVCRMNEAGDQWYEFSVESGGVWYLYAVDGGYNVIGNGGTNALKQGKEVNEYGLVCEGDKITMYVNGDKINTITDTKYGFNEGYAGFNISSLNVLPITVEVNWFEVSAP